jgi:hypothetical protein
MRHLKSSISALWSSSVLFWETVSCSYIKNSLPLASPEVQNCVYKSPPLIVNLRQINPFHNTHPIHLGTIIMSILPSVPGSSKWSLTFGFSDQKFRFVRVFICPVRATYEQTRILLLLHSVSRFPPSHKKPRQTLNETILISWTELCHLAVRDDRSMPTADLQDQHREWRWGRILYYSG